MEGQLLEAPWRMDVACAAVDGGGLRHYHPEREPEIPAVMRERTHRVLAVAAAEAHDGWSWAPGAAARSNSTRR